MTPNECMTISEREGKRLAYQVYFILRLFAMSLLVYSAH